MKGPGRVRFAWLVGLAAACSLACSDHYDSTDDIASRPHECPTGVEYRSCVTAGSCVAWGYPSERVDEIEAPGATDCAAGGGEWKHAECPTGQFVAGCRNVWTETCATIWFAAGTPDLGDFKEACERYLDGVWLSAP